MEAANGIEQGSTKVIALVTEAAEAIFTIFECAGAARLIGMTWCAEDLADAPGAINNRDASGDYDYIYKLARSLRLIGAATGNVLPIETIHGDFRDLDGIRARAEKVRAEGYRGMLAIHPAQANVINEAFTPSEDEIADAQEIVDIFAANPGACAIEYKGGMLDRPYLALAETVLRLAGRL